MSEESTTPDLVELVRRSLDAGSARDFDAMMSFGGPDPVWDLSPLGMGRFEGAEAVRGFFEDWVGAYEEFTIEPEEILDVGNGVVFAVLLQRGRPEDSSGDVRFRYAAVSVWVEGLNTLTTNYTNIDEARAAAERLAEEGG